MIAGALRWPGPRPELAERLRLFGHFVGSLDLDRTSYALDGTTATMAGECTPAGCLTVAPFKTSGSVRRGLRDERVAPLVAPHEVGRSVGAPGLPVGAREAPGDVTASVPSNSGPTRRCDRR
jgi:hypothetical protein